MSVIQPASTRNARRYCARMTDPRVQRLKEVYAAYNDGDLDPMLEWSHEDSEVQRPAGMGTLRGREEIGEWLKPEALEQRGEPLEFRARDDRVFVALRWLARGVGSGAEVEARVFHVWSFRDDRPFRLQIYFDEIEGLAAAGIPEGER
jgi:ketosteroid isomerase-like protein